MKYKIEMNMTELHYVLEGIDSVVGRPIDPNSKDILHNVRKKIAKPLLDHNLITKAKYKDQFAE